MPSHALACLSLRIQNVDRRLSVDNQTKPNPPKIPPKNQGSGRDEHELIGRFLFWTSFLCYIHTSVGAIVSS